MSNNMETEFKNPTENIEILHSKSAVSFIFLPDLHSHYEIYYNISGAKGYMVGGSFYKCEGRDLIVIPKAQVHKVLVKPGVPYERCVTYIDESVLRLIETLCRDKNRIEWLNGNGDGSHRAASLTPEEHEQYILMISRFNTLNKNGEKLLAVALFLEILDFIGGVLARKSVREYIKSDHLSYADQAMRQIEKDFKTATVAGIAASINLNKDYLNRVFREETGMTVSRYLILRKLTEAKKHLYLGESAKAACVLSGFNNYANFTRTFKKHEGCSPKDFQIGE